MLQETEILVGKSILLNGGSPGTGHSDSCPRRAWLEQDVETVKYGKMIAYGDRLVGHKLGQMAGIGVIKPRETIFKAEIESKAQQDNDEKMLCKP